MSGVPPRLSRKTPAAKAAAEKAAAEKAAAARIAAVKAAADEAADEAAELSEGSASSPQPEQPVVNGAGDAADIVRKTLQEVQQEQQPAPAPRPEQPLVPVVHATPFQIAAPPQPPQPGPGFASPGGHQQAPPPHAPFMTFAPPPVTQFHTRPETDVLSLRLDKQLKRWLGQRLKVDPAVYNLPDGALPATLGALVAGNYHECLRLTVQQIHGYDIGPAPQPPGGDQTQ